MKTIVVAYDESPESERALERAVTIAKALGSHLIVTSVAPITVSPGRGGAIDATDTPADHVAELEHARKTLEGEGVQADYVPAVGHPDETIAEVAKEKSADLVVVGSREVGFVKRALGQSVSEGVAHRVECDLLIVH
ncbi:MAG TPA: universal stress protein [Thermoleophilaceae bacterium]|jgi:nucleotide-binding universal stress UspA family protein